MTKSIGLFIAAVVGLGALLIFAACGGDDSNADPPAGSIQPFASPDINNTVSGSNCAGDKVATFAEVNSAGPQKEEIGGGGIQHVDFYPDRGVPAISYIVPPSEPGIWYGFGSIWEWQCSGFDFVADATRYAQGRMNNGHSGLVIDLRGKTPQVVANVGKLSAQQINDLLARHALNQSNPIRLASLTGNATVGTTAVQPPQQPGPAVQQPAQAAPSCPDGQRGTDFSPVPNQYWSPGDPNTYRVINVWSNWTGQDQNHQYKVLLSPGDPGKIAGGGSYWSWPANCGQAAQAEYNRNPLPSS